MQVCRCGRFQCQVDLKLFSVYTPICIVQIQLCFKQMNNFKRIRPLDHEQNISYPWNTSHWTIWDLLGFVATLTESLDFLQGWILLDHGLKEKKTWALVSITMMLSLWTSFTLTAPAFWSLLALWGNKHNVLTFMFLYNALMNVVFLYTTRLCCCAASIWMPASGLALLQLSTWMI